uniref:Solute carrier family 23 member 2 n=1 Tax=Neogobius melanostomus TaxID=47308 RepID=A0A8C6TSR0_9GOBI
MLICNRVFRDTPPMLPLNSLFQHYLTAFGGIITIPLLLSERLCLQHDSLTQGRLINNIFFVSGICTVLQVTLGVRLPILQGGTFALVTPAMALLSLPEFQCPAWTQNASLVNTSSPVFIDVWQSRLRTLQGSIMVASVLQIVVGFSGLIGFLMRFIGPLTIAPTVSVIGLSLYDVTGDEAGSHWGISALTAVLIVLFSQYLCRVPLPAPSYNRVRKWHTSKFFIFQNVPVYSPGPHSVSWLVSGYMARTDVKERVIGRAAWLSFPYPALAGVWFGNDGWDSCAPWQSLWDYHLCARLSGELSPPARHQTLRVIAGIDGAGALLWREYLHFWRLRVLGTDYSQLDTEEPARYRYRYCFIQPIIHKQMCCTEQLNCSLVIYYSGTQQISPFTKREIQRLECTLSCCQNAFLTLTIQ